MTPGSLLCDYYYPFRDGKVGKKILVVLNDGNDYPYIVVKVTSQQKNRGSVYGCQHTDRFPNFYLPKESCYLKEHSWIQLEDFREFDRAELLNRSFKEEIVKLAELPKSITVELLECAILCQDISIVQIEILKKTIKEIKPT